MSDYDFDVFIIGAVSTGVVSHAMQSDVGIAWVWLKGMTLPLQHHRPLQSYFMVAFVTRIF